MIGLILLYRAHAYKGRHDVSILYNDASPIPLYSYAVPCKSNDRITARATGAFLMILLWPVISVSHS